MKISRRARVLRRTLGALLQEDGSLEEQRAGMDRAAKLPRPRKMRYDDATVGGVRAIVATPTGVDATRHILYLHGGGYGLGSPESHVSMVARLAKRVGAVATLVDYRLAPEHVYPAAIDDCVLAYRALASRVDPSMITIAGDSAGGGAALAMLSALRDAGDSLPACAYLLSPWTDLTASGESVTTRANVDPMITSSSLESFARRYAGETPLDDPGVSPLFTDLSGFPPLLIQTGMDEILLSDSTRLAERAAAAGVYFELDLADGMWHVYPMFAGLMREANEALIHASRFIRAHTLP
jgi:monoterpene epsilon-lactone hydrolase